MSDQPSPLAAPDIITVGNKIISLQEAKNLIKSSAIWLWFVAGMSLINSVFAMLHLSARIPVGLAITRFVDTVVYYQAEIGKEAVSPTARITHGTIVLLILGCVYLVGKRARGGSSRAFFLGMVFYGLDSALLLLSQDWVAVIGHAVILFLVSTGYVASKKLDALQQVARMK